MASLVLQKHLGWGRRGVCLTRSCLVPSWRCHTLVDPFADGYRKIYGIDCQRVEPQLPSRGGPCRASNSKLWVPGEKESELSPMAQTAVRLKEFMDGLPEVPEDVLGTLLGSLPSILQSSLSEVRTKLEAMSTQLEVPMDKAVKLVAKVPSIWNRSPEAMVLKLSPLASLLGLPVSLVVDLIISQPSVYQITQVNLVKDRLEALADRLAVTVAETVELVGRQALLWVVDPSQVKNSIPQIRDRLGLSPASAVDLVCRMPVVLVLEPEWLSLSMSGACATLGVDEDKMTLLVSKCLSLVVLPTELLTAGVEGVAAALDVGVDLALDLMIRQPTLMVAQVEVILYAMDNLASSPLLTDPSTSLRMLVQQPALLYEMTSSTISSRLEDLAALLDLTQQQAIELALEQPTVLVLAPSTLKMGVAAMRDKMNKTSGDIVRLLAADPGAFIAFGCMDNVVDAWTTRLGLPPQAVTYLMVNQPALLDITPNTVKARLESLAALFEVPIQVATQLVLKHPALAVIPPNATITRAKNLSLQLKVSMQRAGTMIAKEPACLCMDPKDLKPYLATMLDVAATYEYYTLEWLQKQNKEQQARPASFSQIHGR